MSSLITTTSLNLKLNVPFPLPDTYIRSRHPVPLLRGDAQSLLIDEYIRAHILPVDPCTVRRERYLSVHDLGHLRGCFTGYIAELLLIERLIADSVELLGLAVESGCMGWREGGQSGCRIDVFLAVWRGT